MEKQNFYFDLPEELIAQDPLEDRSSSRLLVLDKENGKVKHQKFTDILDYLKEGDCLVLNNTKVIPARLIGERMLSTSNKEEIKGDMPFTFCTKDLSMLKQIMTKPAEIVFEEVPVPEITETQVLVKIMNIGLIIAGGVGQRMKMNVPKQFIKVLGKPIMIYTLEAFERNENIDEVVAIIRKSASIADSKLALCEAFGLSEVQATAIVQMQLGKLAGMEKQKIEEELAEKLAFIKVHNFCRDSSYHFYCAG